MTIEADEDRGAPMGKGFFSSTKAFLKNLGSHLDWVAAGKESPGTAWRGVWEDTRKLWHVAASPKAPENRQQAVKLAQRGQARYNKRKYEQAELDFRHAITYDPDYALAHLYLGHTLYKLERLDHAIASWQRAADLDPASDEAHQATRKLLHVQRRQRDVQEHLEQRLRKS